MMMCTYARRYWDWSIVVAVMMLLPQLLANGAWAQDKPKIEIVPGTGHFEGINAVAVSPEGARVLSGGWDGSVKLWDVATGRLIHTFTAGTETVYSVAFSPDGAQFVAGYGDRTAKLWDAASGQLVRTLPHPDFVASVAFSPDGTKFCRQASGATG